VVRLLREIGFETTYVAASELLRKSWIAKIPAKRLWQSVGETLAAALDDRQADVVVTNGPIGLGIKGKVLSAHYYHGTYVGQADAVRRFISLRGYLKMRYLDGMILERLAGHDKRCVACSDKVSDEVRQWFGHQARVVWYPVDLAKFAPGPRDLGLLESFGLDARRPVGIFVGVGRPMKNETAAFEVMDKTLGRITWLAVGENSGLAPGNAVMANRILPELMPALLRSVDLVLSPSVYDPFPFFVAEALATGVPVIATAETGSGALLLRKPPLDQWLVRESFDVDALTNAVLAVIDDPPRARQLALEGRERVGRFLSYSAWRDRFLQATGIE